MPQNKRKENKMNEITVAELKAKLQKAIEELDCLDDNAKVVTSCNTYGMYGHILEIPQIGFVDIMNIKTEDEDEED